MKQIILKEMKALSFNEDEIVECLKYKFGMCFGAQQFKELLFYVTIK